MKKSIIKRIKFVNQKVKIKKINKNHNKYFSNDYFESKQKFLVKTKGFKHYSKKIIRTNKDLTIDVAIHELKERKKNKKNKKLLLLISGVHGVEGYNGSAVQLYFLDKFFPKIKNEFSVILIHAYNPYGFLYNRRVNENNVDLNRNCLDKYVLSEEQKKYLNIINSSKKMINPSKPRKNFIIENYKHNLLIFKTLIKHGLKKTIIAGTSGQNIFPQGVGYVGIKSEPSTIFFKKFVDKLNKKYDEVFFLDIHSGLGKKFDATSYTFNEPGSKEYLLLKKLCKTKHKKRFKTAGQKGSLSNYFFNKFKGRKIDVTLEFGTISRISGALSLKKLSKLNVAENQVTFLGPSRKLEKIRRKYKKAYYPNTIKYKFRVLKHSDKFFKNLCQEFKKY